MRSIVTNEAAWSVCFSLCLCVLGIPVSPAKWLNRSRCSLAAYSSRPWERHLANTTERSVRGGDAVLCQVTFITRVPTRVYRIRKKCTFSAEVLPPFNCIDETTNATNGVSSSSSSQVSDKSNKNQCHELDSACHRVLL